MKRLVMATDSKFARLMDEHRMLLQQFVATELDLAITFCDRASTVYQSDVGRRALDQEEAFHRNVENARRAYQSALHAIERSDGNIVWNSDVAERMDKLRPMLAELEQHLTSGEHRANGGRR
jgi:hypothetical protein